MSNQGKEQYLISELANKAAISVRTIRYYIEEGLLPAPQLRGRYSLYDEDYLYLLMLIKHLQEAHLPLKEIRHQIERLTPEEVIDLLRGYGEDIPSVSNHLSVQDVQLTLHEVRDEAITAKEYIARILDAHTPPPRKLPSKAESLPLPAKPAMPASALPHDFTLESNIHESVWRRIIFAPGVELHVNQLLGKSIMDRVQQLMDFASKIF